GCPPPGGAPRRPSLPGACPLPPSGPRSWRSSRCSVAGWTSCRRRSTISTPPPSSRPDPTATPPKSAWPCRCACRSRPGATSWWWRSTVGGSDPTSGRGWRAYCGGGCPTPSAAALERAVAGGVRDEIRATVDSVDVAVTAIERDLIKEASIRATTAHRLAEYQQRYEELMAETASVGELAARCRSRIADPPR